MRDGGGNLRLIVWELSSDGNTITRRGTATAGAISEVALCRVAQATSTVVTAVRDSDGDLKLIAWEISDGGNSIARTSGIQAGNANRIAVESTFANSSRDFVISGMRDSDGNLRLINWEANLKP
jgi:hypothetical protein